MEKWKRIDGFPLYAVSNYGRIKSYNNYHRRCRMRILKPNMTQGGYVIIALSDSGKRTTTTVSRLVAKAFVPNPENKPEINHKNGVKSDNFYLNLEWMTSSENKLHAYHNGLMKPRSGESCGLSRLTEEDVREIRGLAKENPSMTYREIGEKFGATASSIGKIIRRDQWRHI